MSLFPQAEHVFILLQDQKHMECEQNSDIIVYIHIYVNSMIILQMNTCI